MNNQRTQTRTQQQAQRKTQAEHHPSDLRKCPYCGTEVDKRAEFCPHCGKKLVDYCTFCGAPMEMGETVCEECGMPANGVKCPNCGTLNVRSYCRHCNTPLTKAAQRAIEKAKQDPKVQQAAALIDRAAELEALLEKQQTMPAEAEQRLMELLGQQAETFDVEEIQAEYQRVVKDINQLFDEMLPPAGSTPQEQYNYYSARKVAIETTRKVHIHTEEKVRTGWVCNYCGCFHNQPSECCEPWRGGTWQYETIIVDKDVVETTKEYKYED